MSFNFPIVYPSHLACGFDFVLQLSQSWLPKNCMFWLLALHSPSSIQALNRSKKAHANDSIGHSPPFELVSLIWTVCCWIPKTSTPKSPTLYSSTSWDVLHSHGTSRHSFKAAQYLRYISSLPLLIESSQRLHKFFFVINTVNQDLSRLGAASNTSRRVPKATA
jgi:hypothetical protein